MVLIFLSLYVARTRHGYSVSSSSMRFLSNIASPPLGISFFTRDALNNRRSVTDYKKKKEKAKQTVNQYKHYFFSLDFLFLHVYFGDTRHHDRMLTYFFSS